MKLQVRYRKTPQTARHDEKGATLTLMKKGVVKDWIATKRPQTHDDLLIITHAPKVCARIRGGSTRQRRIAVRRLLAWISSGGNVAPKRSALIGRPA